ncbi:MAG: D-alanyl-D-alanine carboxypeptidase [Deltaproteobacteria bacterium]|jgi:D-alanyl-D-alanine carboxypeptidase/D-alanyl-D-alanine-endopeptidase (penicillin-binding protein 4)|nr:D-alanyl-D-alanine carboxypeptidase [Deltaproteobacteria bacterium]
MAPEKGSVITRHWLLLVAIFLCSGLLGGLAASPAWPAPKAKAAVQKSKKAPAKKPGRAEKKTRPARRPQAPDPEKLPFPENIQTLAGSGAVLITDHHAGRNRSRDLFALNPDKTYVPASILKLVTVGAALDILGPAYRFRTDFYADSGSNLWIAGRGDPFVVSEELCLIMDRLKQAGLKQVKDIYLDTSFFEPGLILDGNNFTINPYDAYNSAFGVNFNTVNYLIDRKGQIVECDPCTPLTPVTVDLAERNRPKKGRKNRYPREFRLNISDSPQEAEKNSAQMVRALLEKNGLSADSRIFLGQTLPKDVRLVYSHLSTRTLEDMIKELLKHSNNFVTNQIFLTMGAEKYGAPATPEKGQQAVRDFLAKYKLPPITVVEGSGLSRLNQVTAHQMARVLGTLEPVRHLISTSSDGLVIAKTGTMSDIQTLAGYLVRPDRLEEPLSFVILLNGAYKPGTRDKILKALKAQFLPGGETEPAPRPEVRLSRSDDLALQQRGLFSPAESAL